MRVEQLRHHLQFVGDKSILLEKTSILEAPQPPIQEELQQKQIEATIKVPLSTPPITSPFVPSSDLAIVQSEAGSFKSIS